MIVNPLASPHVRNPGRIPSLMARVIFALVPATLFGVYQFGWPAVNLLLLCLSSSLIFEWIALRMAGKSGAIYLSDGSALLTGLLIALTLPPWAPWWIAVCGCGFGVIVGKQVFGGIGQNPFNPAMLARTALLLSFPVQMTSWVMPAPMFADGSPGFMEALEITFTGLSPADGISSATLLGDLKTELQLGISLQQALAGNYSFFDAASGMVAGSMGETSAVLLTLGGLYLLYQRVISWHLPLSMLGTIALLASVFNLIDPQRYADALFHLSSGAVVFGAFFIITDPVTSPSTKRGQLLFGAGCGLLVFVIRTWGGYPEAMAFAVLLMNALTPLIDHLVRPRVYGRDRNGAPLSISSRTNGSASNKEES